MLLLPLKDTTDAPPIVLERVHSAPCLVALLARSQHVHLEALVMPYGRVVEAYGQLAHALECADQSLREPASSLATVIRCLKAVPVFHDTLSLLEAQGLGLYAAAMTPMSEGAPSRSGTTHLFLALRSIDGERCRLRADLAPLGIEKGDRITPLMLEAVR